MSSTRDDLRPGDVLLFHNNGFVPWAIRTFDGTEVGHAAVVLGDGQLAEASGRGLTQRAVGLPGNGEYVLVHRLPGDADLGPVVARARALLAEGHLYAYQQIVLLAVLTLTRRLPLPAMARRLVRSALDHAAAALSDLLPVGARWMICSEYVYRCYDDAAGGTPGPTRLRSRGSPSPPRTSRPCSTGASTAPATSPMTSQWPHR